MNTSYKIVLVVVAAVCVVVLLYSLSDGSGEAEPALAGTEEAATDRGDTLATADPLPGRSATTPPITRQETPTPPVEDDTAETTDADAANDLLSAITSITNPSGSNSSENPGGAPLVPGFDDGEEDEAERPLLVFGDEVEVPATDNDDLIRQPPGEATAPVVEETPAAPVDQPIEETTTVTDTTPATIPDGGTYKVKEGDTLSVISQTLYGSARYWVQIAQANPTMDPQKLRIGQVIKLPKASDINTPSTTSTPVEGDLDNVPPNAVIYTVRAGDTLSSISIQYYKTDKYWDLIHDANRARIGDSPDKIREGMKIVIPPSPNRAQ